MPKILLGVAAVFLALSAVFGVLNAGKSRAWRSEAAKSDAARAESERLRAAREKEIKTREAAVAAANAKLDGDQSRVAESEAEFVKAQTEKQELQAKLRADEAEIAELKRRLEMPPTVMPPPPAASATTDLHAELADTRKQLDAAEREKSLLADKISTSRQSRPPTPVVERKRRPAPSGNPSIRGTVLAVNQAYNFVVLNLGGRQGIEANSEMLVLRGGSLIGKIRVSSVEPATAIGDIITSSLARGVQVQPGDIVIYAGSNS